MKRFTSLYLLMVMILLLVNCSQENVEPESKGSAPNTPESVKEKLHSSGLSLAHEMSSLEQSEGSQAMISLATLMDESTPEARVKTAGVHHLLSRINGFTQQTHEINDLTSFRTRDDIEALSLDELWDDYKGTLTWNNSQMDWDYQAGDHNVTFLFPSTGPGSANNARLTIQSFQTTPNIFDDIDDYLEELPTEIIIDLAVNEEVQTTFELTIQYSSTTYIERVDFNLFINPYTLTAHFSNSSTKLSSGFSFKNDTQLLMEYEINVVGRLTEEAISESQSSTEIVDEVSVSLTLLNVNFNFAIDYPEYQNGWDEIYQDEYLGNFDYDKASEETEALLNETIQVTAKFTDQERSFAEVEWYSFVESDTWSYDGETYTDYYVEYGAYLLFEDESKVDLEDYLSTGFDEVEAELEKLEEQFENDLDWIL